MRNTYLYLIIVFSLTLSACDSGEDYDNSAFFNELKDTNIAGNRFLVFYLSSYLNQNP